jgi:beta-1,4-galactosyltransferase 1
MNKQYIILFLLLIFYIFILFQSHELNFFDIIAPPIEVKKVAVIFPYRDQEIQNRSEHLKKTLEYYDKLNLPNIDFYVIEQGNDKKFNRGILMNAGHDLIKKSGKNYVNEIHHDIDVQPDSTLMKYFYSKDVIACKKAFYDHFFGTLSVMPVNIMDKVNGYSNSFWGWGVEDDNLSSRLRHHGIKVYNADPRITKLTELPHKNAWELNIVNPDRHIIDDKDKAEGYVSGLADLKYTIIATENLNSRTIKYTIDF